MLVNYVFTEENILGIYSDFEITNILHIDEETHRFKITHRVTKWWYDNKVIFQNLKLGKENLILYDDRGTLWIPVFEEINMENIHYCQQTPKMEHFKVVPNKNFDYKKNPITEIDNSFLFNGSENMLYQDWYWTCAYTCSFDYQWYPFDTQNCYIIRNVSSLPYKIVDKNVTYTGSHNIGKYFFHSISHCDVDKFGTTGSFIDFIIKRQILNNFLTMFLPTGMLLLISQVSTAYSQSFKDMVIEVNTTLLLVLTTL